VTKRKPLIIAGIDLAGSPRRPTGICILRGLTAQAHIAFADDEILHWVTQAQPDLVPIDAPLTLPPGRTTIHDRTGEHFRPCDRAMQRLGIRFFPITIGPMRMLTERGMTLRKKIEALGYRTVECYPGAAQDIWGLPRQHRDRVGLLAGLRGLGVNGLPTELTGDELDGVTAALVGRWFLQGKGVMVGGAEGIIVPARPRKQRT
jgi:predicted nuclease with RNAse H fold